MEFVPGSELDRRLARIQQWMQYEGLDAVFVVQNADLFYFAGTIQTGILCISPSDDPLYFVQKSLARARSESAWERLLPMKGLKSLPDVLAGEGFGNPRRIGLELDVLPAAFYFRLRDLFPEAELVDAGDAIRRIRMTKSNYETSQMRRAAAMLGEAFARIPGWMSTDMTELELAARLESFLRRHGHQGMVRMRGFNLEIGYGAVSSGASASLPTGFPGPVGFTGLYPAISNGPSRRLLSERDPLMVDLVGGYGGYLADKTRTYAFGDPPRDMAAAHDFILEMTAGIEAMLKPGTRCDEVCDFAFRMVADSPYAESFMGVGDSRVRFVGHGVGLELDELPVLAAGFETALEEGMTIAVEPKIFFPDRGGVGIENTYLLTADGCENLTVFDERIIRAVPSGPALSGSELWKSS